MEVDGTVGTESPGGQTGDTDEVSVVDSAVGRGMVTERITGQHGIPCMTPKQLASWLKPG